MKNWYDIFNNILKCTTGSTKIVVQEIINEFLDPENLIKESDGEDLIKVDLEHSNIRAFKDINTLAVLNAHVDQGALDLFVTLLVFCKLVVEDCFFCLGEIVFGIDMVGANAYYLLRRLIRDYKVNPNRGIKEWSDRVKIL